MCQVKCPVSINTGELIKTLRADELNAASKSRGYGISQVLPQPVDQQLTSAFLLPALFAMGNAEYTPNLLVSTLAFGLK